AQAVDGGDAVAGVQTELGGVGDMTVSVDQAWDDGLAGEGDPFGSGWNGDARGRTGGDDLTVPNHQDAVFDARFPGAVDEASSGECADLGVSRAHRTQGEQRR